MKFDGWKYYNHAAISDLAPHENVDISVVESGEIFNMQGKPLFARWTSDFDCGYETSWWHLIKDEPFDLMSVKAKRRYEVNKGIKNFEVKRIITSDYAEEIYNVYAEAYKEYPAKYRPSIDKEKMIDGLSNTDPDPRIENYGAFDRETGTLCGFAWLRRGERELAFCTLKTMPVYEGRAINAAMVYFILEDNKDFLSSGGYICDGERSIVHETAFQDYLEKYFGFRKAYCRLNVKYRKGVRLIVKVAYCFRGLLKPLDGIRMVHNLNALVAMEKILLEQKKRQKNE